MTQRRKLRTDDSAGSRSENRRRATHLLSCPSRRCMGSSPRFFALAFRADLSRRNHVEMGSLHFATAGPPPKPGWRVSVQPTVLLMDTILQILEKVAVFGCPSPHKTAGKGIAIPSSVEHQ